MKILFIILLILNNILCYFIGYQKGKIDLSININDILKNKVEK